MVESPGFHVVGEKWKQGDQLEGDCNGPGEGVVVDRPRFAGTLSHVKDQSM